MRRIGGIEYRKTIPIDHLMVQCEPLSLVPVGLRKIVPYYNFCSVYQVLYAFGYAGEHMVMQSQSKVRRSIVEATSVSTELVSVSRMDSRTETSG